MDNYIIPAVGTVGLVMAQVSTSLIESITPLGIVALVVYYFLIKFDRKMDALMERTKNIEAALEERNNDQQ